MTHEASNQVNTDVDIEAFDNLPSVAGEFLSDGAVDKMFLWDPLVAGSGSIMIDKSNARQYPF